MRGSEGRLLCGSLAAVFLLSHPATGIAQTNVPPESLKGRLLELGVLGSDPFAPEQVAALANMVALEVSTAPTGTSTGAFTFTWDNELGTFRRSTSSFGPMFAERSLTIGKGKFAAGLNWLHSTYDTLAGMDVDSGELRTVQNLGGDRLSFVTMKLDLSSDTVVAFASYGLTDEAEVAVAVPWVRVALGADINAFALARPIGDLRLPRTATAGLGDIALVGKYRFWRHKDGGLAAGLELRLPSGDTNELRGLGMTRTLVSAIWSRGGTVSPHANVGYEIWSNDVPIAPGRGITARHQWRYACGIEFTPHPRLTAVIDLVGRRLLGGGALGFRTFADPLFGSVDVLVGLPHGFNVVSLAPGVKWNVAGNVLLTANVLASVANDGVRADAVPVIGLDWAF